MALNDSKEQLDRLFKEKVSMHMTKDQRDELSALEGRHPKAAEIFYKGLQAKMGKHGFDEFSMGVALSSEPIGLGQEQWLLKQDLVTAIKAEVGEAFNNGFGEVLNTGKTENLPSDMMEMANRYFAGRDGRGGRDDL